MTACPDRAHRSHRHRATTRRPGQTGSRRTRVTELLAEVPAGPVARGRHDGLRPGRAGSPTAVTAVLVGTAAPARSDLGSILRRQEPALEKCHDVPLLRGETVRVRIRELSAILVRASEPLPPSVAREGQFRIGGRPPIVEAGHALDRSVAAEAGAVVRPTSTVTARASRLALPRPRPLVAPVMNQFVIRVSTRWLSADAGAIDAPNARWPLERLDMKAEHAPAPPAPDTHDQAICCTPSCFEGPPTSLPARHSGSIPDRCHGTETRADDLSPRPQGVR